MTTERAAQTASQLIERAVADRLSIAVAESLTGGLVASTLVGIPGVSDVFRGGIVSYQTSVKAEVLGVPNDLLDDVGPVDPRVAQQMAERVRDLFAVDGRPAALGLATTGVAGPTEQHGHPVGEVFIAVATSTLCRVEHVLFPGSRDEIRDQAVAAVLQLAVDVVTEMSPVRE